MKFINIIAISFLFGLHATSLYAENFNKYDGSVNGNDSTFKLCWLGDSVVGTFVQGSQNFTLAGDNTTQGELFMSVAYLGRTVAYIKAHKSVEGGFTVWTGSMRIEADGNIVPVEFKRKKN